MFKSKPLCEVPNCKNKLSDDPYTIVIDDFSFQACDECGILIETIYTKYDERFGDTFSQLD